jgi:hypothetical protein
VKIVHWWTTKGRRTHVHTTARAPRACPRARARTHTHTHTHTQSHAHQKPQHWSVDEAFKHQGRWPQRNTDLAFTASRISAAVFPVAHNRKTCPNFSSYILLHCASSYTQHPPIVVPRSLLKRSKTGKESDMRPYSHVGSCRHRYQTRVLLQCYSHASQQRPEIQRRPRSLGATPMLLPRVSTEA